MKCITYQTCLAEDFQIRCQVRRDLSEDAECSYISAVNAVIFSKSERAVGYFDGYVIHLTEIATAGEDLFSECDRHSETLCDLYEHLLMEGRPLGHSSDEGVAGDLFHMDHLLVVPEHRGVNLGLSACVALMTLMQSECAYASMKPFPLQWDKKVDGNEAEYERDLAKLITHYQPLGFTAITDGGGFFYRKLHGKNDILVFNRHAWRKARKSRLPTCPDWSRAERSSADFSSVAKPS